MSFTRTVRMEADAWLMEQPWSVEGYGIDFLVGVEVEADDHFVAAEGVEAAGGDVGVGDFAVVPGVAVVVEDDFLVQVVKVGWVHFLHGGRGGLALAEVAESILEGGHEEVDFVGVVVDVEAGAGGGGDAEAVADEGHGAMVSGADGDAGLVEDGAEVVGVDVGGGEGDDAAALGGVGGAVEGEFFSQRLEGF